MCPKVTKTGFGALHLSLLFIFNPIYQNIGAMLLVLALKRDRVPTVW
jgi:hypothetical protein